MKIVNGKFSAPNAEKLDSKSLAEIEEENLTPQIANLSLMIIIADKIIQDEIKQLEGV